MGVHTYRAIAIKSMYSAPHRVKARTERATHLAVPETPHLPCSRLGTAAAGAWLSVCLSFCAPCPTLAASDATVKVFENSCAGCHAGGGNIVKRDATLALSDLQKYGLDGPDQLYDIIYKGRGSMPGFGEGCTPKGACTFAKRLADDEVRDLAAYILEQPW